MYTDGGCLNNGHQNAIAGCGIYFTTDDKRNTSFKLKKKGNYKITNNRAELKAILRAIKILKSEIEDKKIIVIHTDSKYSITSFVSNSLKQKLPNDVPNYDYVIKGNNICKKYSNIKFHHIKAHSGKRDIHSIGNENADRLANIALDKNSTDTVITFGKYKNKTLEEIYQIDKEYLSWCVQNINNVMPNIKLFLEIKNSNLNKNVVNSKNTNLTQEPKKLQNNIKVDLEKVKIHKINGVRCIKNGTNYYNCTNNKNLFATTNDNNEIELVESVQEESLEEIVLVGKVLCMKVGGNYYRYTNDKQGELYAETSNGKVVLSKKSVMNK